MNSPYELDVRPLVAAQRPPLPAILASVSALEPGQALFLIAPFEPVPLYDLLADRGFTHMSRRRDNGDWEITFTPEP